MLTRITLFIALIVLLVSPCAAQVQEALSKSETLTLEQAMALPCAATGRSKAPPSK